MTDIVCGILYHKTLVYMYNHHLLDCMSWYDIHLNMYCYTSYQSNLVDIPSTFRDLHNVCSFLDTGIKHHDHTQPCKPHTGRFVAVSLHTWTCNSGRYESLLYIVYKIHQRLIASIDVVQICFVRSEHSC